jgi:hypothetical protein
MNKWYSILLISLAVFVSCKPTLHKAAKLSDKHATPATQKLFARLDRLTSKGIMFGHRDDIAYGHTWFDESGRSDVKSVCSDYPAVYSWDLGKLEKDSARNLDSVSFDKIKGYVRLVNSWGGINEFTWHCDNPATGGNTWDVSDPLTVNKILPGGEKHLLYVQWLDRLAVYFNGLVDENGNKIPVIFRPFHEQDGSWFWWGKNYCTADEYIRLCRFTVDYLRNTKNIHHLIYACGNTDGFSNPKEYMERYPGDDCIDIIGFDAYQFPNIPDKTFIANIDTKLSIITQLAEKKNKIAALTETGYESVPNREWWTNVLWKAIKKHKISFVLLWRNAHNKPNHFYTPYPGQASEKDLVDFYNMPKTLFLKDISNGEK